MYHIAKIEVDQLCHHTQAYLKFIGKILTIYHIPRSRASERITQLYSDDETLTSNIDDLIIDTISKIRQPIILKLLKTLWIFKEILHSSTFLKHKQVVLDLLSLPKLIHP